MSRRADPQRLYVAHRAGVQRRLMGTGISEAAADAWLTAWETEAASREDGSGSAFWNDGWTWIAAEREKRAKP